MIDARALWRPAVVVAAVSAMAVFSWAAPPSAVHCRRVEVAGKSATACRVDLSRARVRLLLDGPDGKPLHTFAAVESALAAERPELLLAMNAGMFHPSYRPVGLLIEGGKVTSPLNRSKGKGNFFLKPNGVFFVGEKGAGVVETSAFVKLKQPIQWATQSGPLLVQAGAIHPQLSPESRSRLIRNGVGVDAAGKVELVISEDPLNFHEFATLFRDVLHCPDALYLDGTVSSVHGPAIGKSVQRASLGPIIVVLAR
jgi:uncharacterized protein YigE (DUF2233 family)